MEQNQIEHLKKLIASLAEWQLCMSYNDSYFGEPAGLVKSTSRELTKLIESASLDNSTPKSWRDPAKELPEVGQPCLFRYKHGIISGHFAGVDEYKQIIGRTYIWRDQTYIIYGWMPLDEANNWLAQSSAPATVEAERTTAPVSLTDDNLTQEFSLDAIIKGIRYADHGRHEGWQAELKEYIRIECNRAILAAAPAPIQKEPEATHKRQVFMDEIDAAKAGSEWLEPFFGPGFRLSFSVDEGARAPQAKWCILFDSLDRVVAGYMLTRDAKNWTELTKVGPHATPPALAGSQVQAAGDMLQPDDLKALQRFFECCEDFDSGGHDVSKERMARLHELGVVQSKGFGRHQITAFGDYVLCMATNTPARFPLKTYAEHEAESKAAYEAKLAAMREQP